MICASCRPDNSHRSATCSRSQNGLFLTEDGRVFFSTERSAGPPRHQWGRRRLRVHRRQAQLITTGRRAGQRKPILGGANAPGLVERQRQRHRRLFRDDRQPGHPGSQRCPMKIYDARTGGGFPAEREEPKCVAADECHGPGSHPIAAARRSHQRQDRCATQAEGATEGQEAQEGRQAQERSGRRRSKQGARSREASVMVEVSSKRSTAIRALPVLLGAGLLGFLVAAAHGIRRRTGGRPDQELLDRTLDRSGGRSPGHQPRFEVGTRADPFIPNSCFCNTLKDCASNSRPASSATRMPSPSARTAQFTFEPVPDRLAGWMVGPVRAPGRPTGGHPWNTAALQPRSATGTGGPAGIHGAGDQLPHLHRDRARGRTATTASTPKSKESSAISP